MYRVVFFIPIVGIIIFAARGWLYKDLPFTVPVVLLLAFVNAVPIGWVLAEIAWTA